MYLYLRNLVFIIIIAGLNTACMTTDTRPVQDKRQEVLNMKDDVLNQLYKIKPETRDIISNAPGHGVFSNANVNLVFASFGGGYGVVTRKKTGKNTYMKMGEIGIGLGLGVKDFRAVFVFHDSNTMRDFIEDGWQFGGHADAAAKASDKGAAVSGEVLIDNITIYQITESGLALQATLKGAKFWKDDELN